MPEDPAAPPEPPPEIKRPLGMRPNTEAAVREVLARQAAGLRPAHKIVATKHGISWRSLRTAIAKVRSGEMKLGLPEDVQELEIDAGVELARKLKLLRDFEAYQNDVLEALIKQARHYGGRGKLLAYRDMGIPLVISDMRAVSSLRQQCEQGYMAILEKVNREKHLRTPVADVVTEVVRGDPTKASILARRALEADLLEGGEAVPG